MHMFSELDTYVTFYFHMNKNHTYYRLTEKQKDVLNVKFTGVFSISNMNKKTLIENKKGKKLNSEC